MYHQVADQRGVQVSFMPVGTIRILHEFVAGIEKSVPRITDWHHEACLVMTIGDHEGRFFYPTLTRIMDFLSCSPLNTSFKLEKKNLK